MQGLMRAIIQRVKHATVYFEEKKHSEIGHGLCVLVGIDQSDTAEDSEKIARIIKKARLFDDQGRDWKKSAVDIDGEVLCISNFTLCATYNKKVVPDFKTAMKAEEARAIFEGLVGRLREEFGDRLKQGVFGEYSELELRNYGVGTFVADSRKNIAAEK